MDIQRDKTTGKYWTKSVDGWREVPAHVAETSAVDAALINTGEMLTNTGRRVYNTATGLLNRIPGVDIESSYQSPEDAAAVDALNQSRPGAAMAGDMLPYLATAPLGVGYMAARGLVPGASYATGLGAGTGALFEGSEGILPGAVGGLGGDLVGRVLGRAVNAVRGARNQAPTTPMAAQYARTGGRLTPASRTGDEGLQIVEAQLQSNPISSNTLKQIGNENQENLNRLVIDALDMGDDITLDSAGMDLLDRRLGDQFTNLGYSVEEVPLTGATLREISEIAPSVRHLQFKELDDAINIGRRSVEQGGYRPITQGDPGRMLVDPDFPDVTLTGEQAMAVRSEISSALNNAKTAAEILRFGRLLDRFDQQFQSSAGDGAAAIYSDLRNKYQLLQTIKQGNTVSGDGDVSAALLRNRLKNTYGNSYPQRLGEQSDAAARMAQNVEAVTSKQMTVPFGRSGTPERQGLNPMEYVQGIFGNQYLNSGDELSGIFSGLMEPASNPIQRTLLRAGGAGLLNQYVNE